MRPTFGVKAALKQKVAPAMGDKRCRIVVRFTEDCSDTIIVPEARVCFGLIDPVRPQVDKAYASAGGNRPSKVYTLSAACVEVRDPADGSVVISPGECSIVLQTRVPKAAEGDRKVRAWSVFTKFGLSVTPASGILIRSDGDFDVVTQLFRVTYADAADWGCLIFRSTGERLDYGTQSYKFNELLTVHLFRTAEAYDKSTFPAMITLTKLAAQNYVPILPGQLLQVVPDQGTNGYEECQVPSDRSLVFHGQERLGRGGRWPCYRFECVAIPKLVEGLFINAPQTSSVLTPPIYVNGDDVYVVVTEPHKTVKVVCDNITSVRVRFANDIPRVEYPAKFIEIPNANTVFHELNVRFLKRLGTITITNEKGMCSFGCTLPGVGTYYPPSKG